MRYGSAASSTLKNEGVVADFGPPPQAIVKRMTLATEILITLRY
jgi:hypothetical protein